MDPAALPVPERARRSIRLNERAIREAKRKLARTDRALDRFETGRGVTASRTRTQSKRLYRFTLSDYLELGAVFNGPHPETGEDLEVIDEAPEGFPPMDLPPQPAVFAPDYAPEEISEIAARLRKEAGMSEEPSGVVANGNGQGLVEKVVDKVT